MRDFTRAMGVIGKTDRVDARMLSGFGARLQQTADAEARADMRSLIAVLDRRIFEADAQMAALIAADPELAAVDWRLKTVPGVGLSWLQPSSRRCRNSGGWSVDASAPSPVSFHSGRRLFRRTIAGGRPVVRTMLHIAALHASRRFKVFAAFRTRLPAVGNPTRAAITANARKLLGVPGAMLNTRTHYSQTTSAKIQSPANPARFSVLAAVYRSGIRSSGP